jgi:oxygen-independent coproporphyrinogen-3 oxidase
MYAVAMDQLAGAGYEQYEISNFARPGFRCRHNEGYWKLQPYFGFGPGAARYLNGRREINHRSVTTWLKRVFAGRSPIGEAEELDSEERAREALVIGLRCCEGIDREDFCRRTGFTVEELGGLALSRYVRSGHLEETGSHFRLTREGRFVADAVIVSLV